MSSGFLKCRNLDVVKKIWENLEMVWEIISRAWNPGWSLDDGQWRVIDLARLIPMLISMSDGNADGVVWRCIQHYQAC